MGAVLRRELLIAARRRRTYHERLELAAVFGLVVCSLIGAYWWQYGSVVTYPQLRLAALRLFAAIVAGQWAITLAYLPRTVAGAIAGERDQQTLSSLLATELSAGSIVLGATLATLIRYAAWLLAILPGVLPLVMLGGIPARILPPILGASVSLAVAVAALSAWVSVESSGQQSAGRRAAALAGMIVVGPNILGLVLPRIAPAAWPWLAPVVNVLKRASPLDLAFALGRGAPWTTIQARMVGMIGFQALGAILATTGAVLRLRPASRRLEERTAAAQLRRGARPPRRVDRRRPCGDDPMLWKELHTRLERGWMRWVEVGTALILFLTLGLGVAYYLAWPAFQEWRQAGFTAGGGNTQRDLYHLIVRMLTAFLSLTTMIHVCGIAAESIVTERRRDTWTSLTATPLEAAVILRAKRMGAIWRGRLYIGLLVGLWLVGVASGAVHPIALPLGVLVFTLALEATAAWGVTCSLLARDAAEATNRALVPVIVFSLSGLIPLLVPARAATVLEGAASPPMVLSVAMCSPREVREALGGERWESRIFPSRLDQDGPGRYLFCIVLGCGMAFAARQWSIRMGLRRFDAARFEPVRDLLPVTAATPAALPVFHAQVSPRTVTADPLLERT